MVEAGFSFCSIRSGSRSRGGFSAISHLRLSFFCQSLSFPCRDIAIPASKHLISSLFSNSSLGAGGSPLHFLSYYPRRGSARLFRSVRRSQLVMSLHRVASIETLREQHVRRGSDASLHARKLSFNPLPQEWDPTQARPDRAGIDLHQNQERHKEPVGAFEVPEWKRIRENIASFPYPLYPLAASSC